MGRVKLGSWFWAFLLVLPVSAQEPAHSQQQPPAELKAKIASLIKDLGAESFSARQAAHTELLNLGVEAETALRAAADSPDTDVADRARVILGEYAKRRLDARLDKVNWTTILEHVQHHAANDNWQKPGFTDSAIEKAVEKVIAQANQAAEGDRVQLPVRFGGLSPMTDHNQDVRSKSRLFCGRGSFDFGGGEESIFLVDGSVNVTYATKCLIIARGAVTISHGSGNVVLAGQFIDIAHDGSGLRVAQPGPAKGGASLLMSGSILRISHAAQAICSAPDEVNIGATDCVFLNSAANQEMDRGNSRSLNKVALQLQPVATPNPILSQLKITQVVNRSDSRPGYIVFERNGVELVVRPNTEIKDNLGKPVPDLAGWKLSFVADGYALFSNGKEDAGFVLPKRQ